MIGLFEIHYLRLHLAYPIYESESSFFSQLTLLPSRLGLFNRVLHLELSISEILLYQFNPGLAFFFLTKTIVKFFLGRFCLKLSLRSSILGDFCTSLLRLQEFLTCRFLPRQAFIQQRSLFNRVLSSLIQAFLEPSALFLHDCYLCF